MSDGFVNWRLLVFVKPDLTLVMQNVLMTLYVAWDYFKNGCCLGRTKPFPKQLRKCIWFDFNGQLYKEYATDFDEEADF